MRVIIGAGKTNYDGWISTQENELDLTNRADFVKMFAKEKPIAFLAEHVWEHMTFSDGYIAAKTVTIFLRKAGISVLLCPIKTLGMNGIRIW